jgi:hypothetical protein
MICPKSVKGVTITKAEASAVGGADPSTTESFGFWLWQ